MTELNYTDLLLLLVPEVVLVLSGLAILSVDLLWARELPPRQRHVIALSISLFGGLAAVISIMIGVNTPVGGTPWLLLSGATSSVKVGLISLTLATLTLNLKKVFTWHIGEVYLLTLFALAGMLLMASANHFLLAFLALELVSLSFYTLVAFDRQRRAATEAALKYFLLGGVSASFTLLGLSFLYGATGSLQFVEIAAALTPESLSPLLIIGLVAIAIGFAFKVAAVPAHLWAPDVYESAPSPIASLIASASKLAGFYLFARVWIGVLGSLVGYQEGAFPQIGWGLMLGVLTFASLIIGNLAAIVQSRVRRLLAYSAIAHTGYVLLGIMGNSPDGIASVVYYALTYGLAIVGCFAIVQLVEQTRGDDRIQSFANLHTTFPVEAACLMVFILSLAGIPPLAGFFGKFYLFAASLKSTAATDLTFWLVVLAIAMSAVSLYYYLQLLKQVFVVAKAPECTSDQAISYDPTIRVVAILMAIGVIALGLFPEQVVQAVLATP